MAIFITDTVGTRPIINYNRFNTIPVIKDEIMKQVAFMSKVTKLKKGSLAYIECIIENAAVITQALLRRGDWFDAELFITDDELFFRLKDKIAPSVLGDIMYQFALDLTAKAEELL